MGTASKASGHARPRLEPGSRLQFLPGIGPRRAMAFERLGLTTLEQLVRHVPRDWLDARRSVPIRDLTAGELLTVTGRVRQAAALRTRSGRGDFTATIGDGTGTLGLYFFGQSWLARTLVPGAELVVSGELDPLEWRFLNPMFEVLEGEVAQRVHAGRLVPIHALTRGVTARQMREAVRHALDAIADLVPDPLPAEVSAARGLEPLGEALRQIHFPDDDAALERARQRLAFGELFQLQAVMALRRTLVAQAAKALTRAGTGDLAERVRAALPFTLTPDQQSALAEITADLGSPHPMHRLLIGDVGSGKTVVALLAAAHVIEAGHQVALLAPTEILARQHAATLARFARPAGIAVETLTGATHAAARRALQARLVAGEPILVVGTHALLEERVQLSTLGLVIVDEQHRFGVRQRATLARKVVLPDVLVLSATPIPRTLQLAWFGDLDLSVIRARPPGRGRRVTRVTSEVKLPQVIDFMAMELAAGRQAYVVVPAVEEGARAEIRAVETERERLRSQPALARFRIEGLHGRLPGDEKVALMEGFSRGEIHVLVATTVVEVGVDVPNATLMVVLNAERFGLTQLHQLRGRVGRGEHRSVCVFVGGPGLGARGRERLAVMASTDDGFELAESDLRLRGPGDLWGTRQAGFPRLKVANLGRDGALLEQARADAARLVAADPHLSAPAHAVLQAHLARDYAEALALVLAG